MIMFIIYQTKLVDNKLTFEYFGASEEYDTAMKIAESGKNMIVIPFDSDDEEDPVTYYQD